MFEFTIGNIKTFTPWEQPRFDTFRGWWNRFNREVDLSDYRVYLVGSFAENIYGANIPTMDVDIVLRNEVKDYTKLKHILDTAMIMGFESKMFIDIKWSCETLWTEHLGLRKKCQRPSKLSKFTRIKNYNYSIKTVNGITLEKRNMPKDMRCKEIIDGLYEVTGYDYMTASKVNKRMREKTYTGKYMDLKNAFR